MKHKKEITMTFVCMLALAILIGVCSCTQANAEYVEIIKPNGTCISVHEHDYTADEVTYLTNMIYSEISAICYDKRYTEDEQNLAMQEWGRVPINQIERGIAKDLYSLFNMKTYPGSRYYIWHPAFTYNYDNFKAFMKRNRGGFSEDIYERCRINAMIAMENCLTTEVPSNVIYADLMKHGNGAYKTYDINTGYYHSVVYLSYA